MSDDDGTPEPSEAIGKRTTITLGLALALLGIIVTGLVSAITATYSIEAAFRDRLEQVSTRIGNAEKTAEAALTRATRNVTLIDTMRAEDVAQTDQILVNVEQLAKVSGRQQNFREQWAVMLKRYDSDREALNKQLFDIQKALGRIEGVLEAQAGGN